MFINLDTFATTLEALKRHTPACKKTKKKKKNQQKQTEFQL